MLGILSSAKSIKFGVDNRAAPTSLPSASLRPGNGDENVPSASASVSQQTEASLSSDHDELEGEVIVYQVRHLCTHSAAPNMHLEIAPLTRLVKLIYNLYCKLGSKSSAGWLTVA